jgi:hypothetical protein
MPAHSRRHWSRQIEDVIRSKHYTWLGLGLGGDPIDQAMVDLTAKIMCICRRCGIDWQQVVAKSQAKIEQEEREVENRAA